MQIMQIADKECITQDQIIVQFNDILDGSFPHYHFNTIHIKASDIIKELKPILYQSMLIDYFNQLADDYIIV